MNPSVFKLYDIRGKYPEEVNESLAYFLGRQASFLFGNKARLVVGHDSHASSRPLYRALIKGIFEGSNRSISLGLCTTPSLTFAVHRFHAAGAIMVTASHDKLSDNGFKFLDGRGDVIGGREVFKKIKNLKLKARKHNLKIKIKNSAREESFKDEYGKFLGNFINVRRPVKAVIDCLDGSAGAMVRRVPLPSSVKITFVGDRPVSRPRYGANPLLPFAQKRLQREVIKQKADIGIIFDGDGDRAVLCDEKGNILRPEHVFLLLHAQDFFSRVVKTELSSFYFQLIKDEINTLPRFKKSRVGRSFVRQKILTASADAGFENSGHYYFKDFFSADSGIATALKSINAVSSLPYSLSQFVDFLPRSFRISEKNIKIRKIKASGIKKALLPLFSSYRMKADSDGASFSNNFSWYNARVSHTEPIVRLNGESRYPGELRSIIRLMESRLRAF